MMFGGGGGSGDGESLSERMAMLAGIPIQMTPPSAAEMVFASGGGGTSLPQRGKEERVPQWGQQETRDLIAIRADLERDPSLARRNRTLWEAVAARMRERGYRRTPDQCKCKWKNLVNRYKGKETADPDTGRQCPFFDELSAVFVEREKNMQRLLLESESGSAQSKKKLKRPSSIRSSEESGSEDEDDNNSDYELQQQQQQRMPKSRKKKADPQQQQEQQQQQRRGKAVAGSVQELLQEFLQQQQQMEAQWYEMVERRAKERRVFELEWRQSMEKLERERLMLEQAWREREEQRRMREESRAEKRDALLTTLLNKFIQEDL
ncbi:trihelix transcription factor GT-3b-like [Curcuma longa]|uniref:trihelix transcription factor GT-3b-like n=1 Tax=Curcuma longa TaxID=136217 RepID=UPI003D9FA940